LTVVKVNLPTTPDAMATCRELAEREWNLGLARDTELSRTFEG
jgi:hypothetical protein